MRFSNLAAAGAMFVSATAMAGGKVPPGWMEVADSQAQFSSVQGQSGWWYEFDRGEGTVVEAMPYYGSAGAHGGIEAWNAVMAGGSYCIQYGARLHANSPGACSAAGAGVLRPIRRWRSNVPIPCVVTLTGQIAPNTAALRIDLLADGIVAFSQTASNGSDVAVATSIRATLSELAVRLDPVGADCNADVIDGCVLRILTPDCNANSIPDAIEIAGGSVSDTNHDGVPDACQCPADVVENGVVDGSDLAAVLTSWGTDGGIYPRADTNADGVVDGADLATVLGGWGACP